MNERQRGQAGSTQAAPTDSQNAGARHGAPRQVGTHHLMLNGGRTGCRRLAHKRKATEARQSSSRTAPTT